MKKTIALAGITITTALLLAGCSLPGTTATPSPTPDTVQESATSPTESLSQKITNAYQNNGSIQCNSTSADGNNTYEYFLNGKRFRVNGITAVNNQITAYHALSDGIFMYSWSENDGQGMKFKLPSEEELKQQQEAAQKYMESMPDFRDPASLEKYQQDGYKIECDNWRVDESIFTPPSNVEFQDTSAMMQGAQAQQTEMMQSLTPEQQQQIIEAMKKTGQ